MAQQIVTLCDPCLLEGKEAPAQTWGLSIAAPGSKAAPYEIDVCDMHGAPYRDLLEHLGETGRRSDRKRALPSVGTAPGTPAPSARQVATGGGFACPDCGAVSGSESALRSHASHMHGRSLSEMNGDASIPCVADDCDRMFKGFQGVSSHLRTVHGWDVVRAREAVRVARAARDGATV